MAGQGFPSCASAFCMPCSGKGKLTDEDFFFRCKKANLAQIW
jgi:hypothetical protein